MQVNDKINKRIPRAFKAEVDFYTDIVKPSISRKIKNIFATSIILTVFA